MTAVSDMFTMEVVNPVQRFVPGATYNPYTGVLRSITDYHLPNSGLPVLKIQDDDYYPHPSGATLGFFNAFFTVLDSDSKPINGKATNVRIQWIEVPDSVSLLDVLDAQYVGGRQASRCPEGGNVLPATAAKIVDCGLSQISPSDCSDPKARIFLVRRAHTFFALPAWTSKYLSLILHRRPMGESIAWTPFVNMVV